MGSFLHWETLQAFHILIWSRTGSFLSCRMNHKTSFSNKMELPLIFFMMCKNGWMMCSSIVDETCQSTGLRLGNCRGYCRKTNSLWYLLMWVWEGSYITVTATATYQLARVGMQDCCGCPLHSTPTCCQTMAGTGL